MRCLVTGGTGLLGNNLVRALTARGDDVRVLVRRSSSLRALDRLPVEIVTGDVTDRRSVEQAMDEIDWVLHAAADTHIGWTQFDRQRQINVTGTLHVARAAREVGARMVHVSTVDTLAASRDGLPIDEEAPRRCKFPATYVVTKREAEEVVTAEMAEGLQAIIVHPGFMLGPWDWKPSSGRMLLAFARHGVPVAPGGGMSICDPRDVADAIVTAIDRHKIGRRYILAGANVRYLEAWRYFAQVTGRRGPFCCWGRLTSAAIGYAGDFWGHVTMREPEINSALVRMGQMLHYYSSDRARRELDYEARPWRESVRDAWRWFQEHDFVETTHDASVDTTLAAGETARI